MFQRVYYGKVTHPENARLPDLLPHEWSSVVPLCAVALLMGVFPSVFLKPTEPAVTRIVDRLQNTQTLRVERSERSERFERAER
jgi:NADH-quinone oxidoreductase subunit M